MGPQRAQLTKSFGQPAQSHFSTSLTKKSCKGRWGFPNTFDFLRATQLLSVGHLVSFLYLPESHCKAESGTVTSLCKTTAGIRGTNSRRHTWNPEDNWIASQSYGTPPVLSLCGLSVTRQSTRFHLGSQCRLVSVTYRQKSSLIDTRSWGDGRRGCYCCDPIVVTGQRYRQKTISESILQHWPCHHHPNME